MKQAVCLVIGLAVVAVLVLTAGSSSALQDKNVPIKEVMKQAHKGDPALCKKGD